MKSVPRILSLGLFTSIVSLQMLGCGSGGNNNSPTYSQGESQKDLDDQKDTYQDLLHSDVFKKFAVNDVSHPNPLTEADRQTLLTKLDAAIKADQKVLDKYDRNFKLQNDDKTYSLSDKSVRPQLVKMVAMRDSLKDADLNQLDPSKLLGALAPASRDNKNKVSWGNDKVRMIPNQIVKKQIHEVGAYTDNFGGGVYGNIFAPNGVDPIANILVYAPKAGNGNLPARETQANVLYHADVVSECGKPTEAYLAMTCSKADGSFTLVGLPVGQLILKAQKSSPLSFSANVEEKKFTEVSTSLPVAVKMAIVSGQWDRLQRIAAAAGYAKVGSQHTVLNGSQSYESLSADQFKDLLGNPERLKTFSVLLINSDDDIASILNDSALQNNLRNYVTAGGKLLATDHAYKVVQILFPEAIHFLNDNDWNDLADRKGANEGPELAELKADLNLSSDRMLSSWLQNFKCAEGDCVDAEGKVSIKGLTSGWTMMDKVGAHTSTILNANVAGAVRPLIVSSQQGRGRIIYSSITVPHAGDGIRKPDPSLLSAQERIIEYLILQMI